MHTFLAIRGGLLILIRRTVGCTGSVTLPAWPVCFFPGAREGAIYDNCVY